MENQLDDLSKLATEIRALAAGRQHTPAEALLREGRDERSSYLSSVQASQAVSRPSRKFDFLDGPGSKIIGRREKTEEIGSGTSRRARPIFARRQR